LPRRHRTTFNHFDFQRYELSGCFSNRIKNLLTKNSSIMKRVLFALLLIVLGSMGFVSCDKEEAMDVQTEQNAYADDWGNDQDLVDDPKDESDED
jgi:hypothetical protein